MEKSKLRLIALSAGVCAAAALSTAALVYTPANPAAQASQSTTVHVPPVQLPQREMTQQAEPPSPPVYVLRSVDDELCIFRDKTLLRRTGVSILSLPREDRELLSNGIAAASQEALASLLEDLCS